MTQVGVVSPDPRIEELLRSGGFKVGRIATESWSSMTAPAAPAVLVLDVRHQGQLPPALGAFRRQNAASAIVLVAATLDPRLMLEAMRAGVTECVTEPVTPAALETAVRRVLVQAQAEEIGEVFAFVGAKGGVGTTTLAVNTAATLSRVLTGDVLLLDLHLGHGDAAMFLGVEPRFSVVNALEQVQRLDDALLRSFVEETKAGPYLLASSDRTLCPAVDPTRTRALIDFVQQRYRALVLDVPRSDVSMLDSLDRATTIVVVATQELGALRSAARMAQTLTQRYGGTRVRVVVNRFDKNADIGEAEVERVVGLPVMQLIPSDYRAAVDALHTGRPVVLEKERRLARAFQAFASELAGVVRQTRERPANLLGRLAWRRA